ncbi:GNAT family N-acetyltransferase, partial [Prevotella koreensis]
MKIDKIVLRAMEPEDLEELYAIENDRSIWDVGSTNVPYSRYALHEYIANATNDIYADKQLRLIIETNGGGVAGIVDLFHYDP